jgi:hypothetical protein
MHHIVRFHQNYNFILQTCTLSPWVTRVFSGHETGIIGSAFSLPTGCTILFPVAGLI